jgi:hypothetical protein
MKALKSLAVRKGIALIVVSHVSTKESAKEGGATQLSLTDIRASKDVIQDADTVWGLERDRASTKMLLRTLKVHRSAGGRYGEVEFDFVDGRYVELINEDEEYEQRNGNEKQLREIVRETESQPGIRIDKGELLEGVHTGLHKPSEPAKVSKRKIVLGNRSEGKVLEGGRRQATRSEARQPKHEVGTSVSTTGGAGKRKEVSNVSKVGNQTRLHSGGNKRTKPDSQRRATLGGGAKKATPSTVLDMDAIMKRAEELL